MDTIPLVSGKLRIFLCFTVPGSPNTEPAYFERINGLEGCAVGTRPNRPELVTKFLFLFSAVVRDGVGVGWQTRILKRILDTQTHTSSCSRTGRFHHGGAATFLLSMCFSAALGFLLFHSQAFQYNQPADSTARQVSHYFAFFLGSPILL